MVSVTTLSSQTSSRLILPTEPRGVVQLNISDFMRLNVAGFGYDYLSVFVSDEGGNKSTIAVQGEHTIAGNYLVFSPYYPFEKGITYTVKARDTNKEGAYFHQTFQLEKKQAVDKAKVERIYPSGNQLPENLLRFYIYFNTPMKRGQFLEQITLTDPSGKVDDRAFMAFKEELWSPDGKRLTLLFDPGRIKRGVSTNMEIGPALLEGKRYALTISAMWEDVYGQPLSVNTTKEFVVKNAYRDHMNINHWEISKPKADGDDKLTVHFDRIMDHALIQSMIQILDKENNLIVGQWEVLEEEQSIQFTPDMKWKNGDYQIVFDSRLEDVAGNNLQGLLDHEVTNKESNENVFTLKFTL